MSILTTIIFLIFLESSVFTGRQVVRAGRYATFHFYGTETQKDLTVQFEISVAETGKDLNFIFLDYEEFKKWLDWFRNSTTTNNRGETVHIPRPALQRHYEYRTRNFERTYKIGMTPSTLLLDNTYSRIWDKTITFKIVSTWKIESPMKGLPVTNKQIIELPPDVYEAVLKANDSYLSGHYEQCSVMFRKAIDFAIRLKLLQAGYKETALLDENGNDLQLSKKIKLLRENNLITSKTAKQIEEVKWYGDMGAHGKVKLVLEDVKDNLEPKVRSFLTGLDLKT